MMRAFLALTLNGFREARRNRVSVVVALFALLLLVSSSLLTEVTVYTFERVLVDFGLGLMTLALVLLAVFLSSSLLSREIERRTIFLMVSKPISRGLFLCGRLSGNVLTLTTMLGAMAGLHLLQLALYDSFSNYDISIGASLLLTYAMLWLELVVVSCVGFLMSSFASQTVSAIVTVGVYFAGHLSADLYTLSAKSSIPGVPLLGKVAYYLLPNLERVNYRPLATYDEVPPVMETLSAVGYAVGYGGVLVALAVLIFSRRDFK